MLALKRREELAGVGTVASGKQSEGIKNDDGGLGFIARPGARGIDTQRACSASAKPRAAEDEPGRPEKDAGGRAVMACSYLKFLK